MTTVQVTVNKIAGVAVLRTLQGHNQAPETKRSLFSGARRQTIPLGPAFA